MKLLTRYLLWQNLFYIFSILLAGTGLYLLTDLLERLDDFLEAGVSLGLVLGFFALKIPLIISEILPAVFLLAFVVQLNLLDRTRELMALRAGGVSPFVLLRFVLVYGLLWAVGQFFFSQVLGVAGDRIAGAIWQEDVKGRDTAGITIQSRWLTDIRDGKTRILYLGMATPNRGTGENLLVYTLDDSGIGIEEILRAQTFTVEDKRWVLKDVVQQTPATFSTVHLEMYELPIRQNLKSFLLLGKYSSNSAQLPLWELGSTIRQLERTGSNVEVLRTAWHTKLSYAASIVVMGLLALVISGLTSNIYRAVGIALLLIFVFHSINTLSVALGEKGILSPGIAAWLADGLLFALSLSWLSLPAVRHRVG